MKKVLAFIFDFITSFGGFGYIIGKITGGTYSSIDTIEGEKIGMGFNLTGAPALIAIALVIAYFVLLPKFAGGTIWQHILGTEK